MSSGAILQLVAKGAQDVYLTGDPQITYFKTVFKRYSNYALESIQIPIIGTIRPGAKVAITIPKSGDLLKRLWIHYNPSELVPAGSFQNPTNVEYLCSDLGHSLFNKIEIEIGGQIIDTQYGKWLSIWRDLTVRNIYSTAGFICDSYTNYTTDMIQQDGTTGNICYITTQGEEPTINYSWVGVTDYDYNRNELFPTTTQAVTYTNNNGYSNYNFMVSQFDTTYPIASTPLNKRVNINFTNMYDIMAYTHIGSQNLNSYNNPYIESNYVNISTANAPTEAYIPLQFWFCRNPGLALPLIALQYHEIKLHLTLAETNSWVKAFSQTTVTTNINSIKIFADYVYLDSPERKQFSQNAHEYLIDQVQLQTVNSAGTSDTKKVFNIEFNHPVKELIITGNPEYYLENNQYSPFTYPECVRGRTAGGATPAPIISSTEYPNDFGCPVSQTNTTMTLTFNGTDRFQPRNLKYFTRSQVYEHHSGSGGHYFTDDIAVYSFSLKPEDIQPSGSCNMSRLDRVTLSFNNINTLPDQTEILKPLDVYAVNYNVLRVMSGMGGLAYSN